MNRFFPIITGILFFLVPLVNFASEVDEAIRKGLDWLAANQAPSGRWSANEGAYPTAMTSLAVLALTAEGSTTMQGKYSDAIRRGVDFLLAQSRSNGLIGSASDQHYTYGHGYAMLALAQILGEEEDVERREQLVETLVRAVQFTAWAQTKAGGWGYVSAKDGNDFDEGSTTITQVQGLRACRNAGIPVPKETIDKAIGYIHRCTTPEGGVQYSTQGGPGRPAITAAAIACLYNAGDYDDQYVPRMLHFCKENLQNIDNSAMGFWHYAHFYYAQVMYRQGGNEWEEYRQKITKKLLADRDSSGCWSQGFIGNVYTTSNNLVILQLEKGNLPIFQR
ncbi:MAG: terpene cyclase/mutase family protein [Planctomycetia bacterium]|nr:terpene cyclase/mutase family protein [Planctomycetia bacterium]